jgi:hypothetical protein
LLSIPERNSVPKTNSAQELIQLHEKLLFQRTYPANPEALREADQALMSFADRVAALEGDLSAFEEPDVSGIAGTSFSAIFTFEIARYLAGRFPSEVAIDLDNWEKPERIGPFAARFVPLIGEDFPVEANVPYGDWLRAGGVDLARLVRVFALSPESYDLLDAPVRWKLGDSNASRSKTRVPVREIFYHDAPLIRRSEVSLAAELRAAPLPVERLSRRDGEDMLNLARNTSAVRYRELYGFTYGDPGRAVKAEAGRGVEIYVFGLRPEWRLPLRAYHAGLFIKNGVPVGYVETLSLFDRMEVGFNIYYTFREGESAWLYGRTLRLFHQLCGATYFSVDPYQIGFHNEEAIESGAFWFYRKLGFRPVAPRLAGLTESEERKMQTRPGYRTPARTLRRLAEDFLIYEAPGVPAGAWDRFRVRNLGLAAARRMAERFGGDARKMRRKSAAAVARALGVGQVPDLPNGGSVVHKGQVGDLPHQGHLFENLALVLGLIKDLHRWPATDKAELVRIIRAKSAPDESAYLLRMQRHPRLREALLELGSLA